MKNRSFSKALILIGSLSLLAVACQSNQEQTPVQPQEKQSDQQPASEGCKSCRRNSCPTCCKSKSTPCDSAQLESPAQPSEGSMPRSAITEQLEPQVQPLPVESSIAVIPESIAPAPAAVEEKALSENSPAASSEIVP